MGSMPESTPTAFANVTVVPMDQPSTMDGEAPPGSILANQTVIVSDGEIQAVGHSDEVAIPDGVTTIDGTGLFLMPGLADMHIHLGLWDPDPRHLVLYLAEGTTMVRSFSGSPGNATWRDWIIAGDLLGPTILTSGFTLIDGFEGSDEELATLPIAQPKTVQEAVVEVRRQARGPADFLKVYDGLAPDVYLAAIAAAKQEGMYVAGHLLDELPLEEIVAAGIDEVAHLDELNFRHWLGRPDEDDFAMDYDGIAGTAAALADAGVAVVSNLSADEVLFQLILDTDAVLSRPEYRVVRPEVLEAWRHGRQTGRFAGQGQYRRDLEFPFFQALLGGLREAGVPVVVGTDTSRLLEGAVPSRIHREIELLVESGYSNYEAMAAATSTAADVVAMMNRDGRFGRVVTGHRADLLLLAGNPLDDVSQTRNRVGVMVRGSYFPQQDLDRMVDDFVGTYATTGTV